MLGHVADGRGMLARGEGRLDRRLNCRDYRF